MAVKKRRPSVRAAPYDKKAGATKTKGKNSGELVRLKGASDFRYRVVCATLAGKPLVISDIRSDSQMPGVNEAEASFLQLVDLISSGSSISINETGTKLRYTPGSIIGGYELHHDCPPSRGIGYYIEPLILLALFSKKTTDITFTGTTDSPKDLSIDIIRNITVGLARHFGVDEKISVQMIARGVPPKGGGKVRVTIPFVKSALKPLQLLDAGKIKRFRGVSYVCRCSPQFANRMVSAARSILNKFIPDVYIHTDHCKGKSGGLSSGFGISLSAETINGVQLGSQVVPDGPLLPEDLGRKCAKLLVDEIAQRGCVDSNHQAFMTVLMALTPEDVSRLRIGKLSKPVISVLRLVRDFFGVTFMIKADRSNKTVLLSCVGAGYQNFSRKRC
ncbi:hypothetical protein AAMO2058_001089900 [Amorphochlora amoebiformis]